ncbi:troponin C-like isoform X2 [Branchiostoma floridae x Branchiostoma belcheri]
MENASVASSSAWPPGKAKLCHRTCPDIHINVQSVFVKTVGREHRTLQRSSQHKQGHRSTSSRHFYSSSPPRAQDITMGSARDMLSDDLVEEFQMAFDMFDQKGEGEISVQNLGTILKQIGLNPSRKELEEIMAEADEDGSGTMDFDEFLELMAKQMHQEEGELNEDEVRAAFRVFDKNNDGFISMAEWKAMAEACDENLSDVAV